MIIQKSLSERHLSSASETNQKKEIIRLLKELILRKLNIQAILYLFAFLTYGVGDGLTAIYMMDNLGVMRESNPLVRLMYESSGKLGVISLKIWYALMILFFVKKMSKGRTKGISKASDYWMINGFLFALALGGIMAVRSNMMAAFGMDSPSPNSVIVTYLIMVVLFVMIGDLIDKLKAE